MTKREMILRDREKSIRECASIILQSIKNNVEIELNYQKYIISCAYRLLMFEGFIKRAGTYALTDYGEAKVQQNDYYVYLPLTNIGTRK